MATLRGTDSLSKARLCRAVVATLGVSLLAGCGSDSGMEFVEPPVVKLDPLGVAPLTASLDVQTSRAGIAVVEMSDGLDTTTIEFSAAATVQSLPLLGLKPDRSYSLSVTVTDATGAATSQTLPDAITTAPLPSDFPSIEVLLSRAELMEPGYTLTGRTNTIQGNSAPGLAFIPYSFIMDNSGEVVWYSPLGDYNIEQTANADLRYLSRGVVVEQSLLGKVTPIAVVDKALRGFHHEFTQTPVGTFLTLTYDSITVDDYPASTMDPSQRQTATLRNDPIWELEANGAVRSRWDPAEILDTGRTTYLSLRDTDLGYSWAHLNAATMDPDDNNIIVSSRAQNAVIKFSRDTGEIKWILGSPDNWPTEFQRYLLTPATDKLDWPYAQHAPQVTSDGTLMIFDNGNFRADPFDGTEPVEDSVNFSRAVEYRIDEATMSVSEVWEYELTSPREFSMHMGDANVLPATGNVLITFPGIRFTDGTPISELGLGAVATRIVEVTHESPAEKVFEALLYDPAGNTLLSLYRSERIPTLYPPGVQVSHSKN